MSRFLPGKHTCATGGGRRQVSVLVLVGSLFASAPVGCSLAPSTPPPPPPTPLVGAAPTAVSASTAPLPRLWLRGTAVLEAPAGKEIFRAAAPTLVELMPDDRIRSLPGAATPFVGFLSSDARDKPSDLQGLGLYAQRIGELHLGSPSGPIIGRIFPGAYVGVVSLTPPTAVIAVPLFESPVGTPILAHLDASVLGPEPGPLVEQPPVGKLVDDWGADLSAELEGDRFTRTVCGELRVVAERPRSNGRGDVVRQVAQRRDGIEIVGWTVGGISDANRCAPRVVWSEPGGLVLQDGPRRRHVPVSAVPQGFVPVPSGRADPLAAALRGYAPVFWLVQTEHGPRCMQWKPATALVRGHDGSISYEGRIEHRETEGDELIITRYDLSYAPFTTAGGTGALTLLGPDSERRRLSDQALLGGMGLACGETYMTTAAADDVVTVLPGQVPHRIVAFHPDDAERWYLTEGACRVALAKATAAPGRGELAALGLGFHRGC
jgi:hypothetical protein